MFINIVKRQMHETCLGRSTTGIFGVPGSCLQNCCNIHTQNIKEKNLSLFRLFFRTYFHAPSLFVPLLMCWVNHQAWEQTARVCGNTKSQSALLSLVGEINVCFAGMPKSSQAPVLSHRFLCTFSR